MKSVDLRIRFARFIAVLTFAAACLSPLAGEAATKIERVVSPGGIEAWLVRDNSIPVIGMEFAFRGGANADPKEKSGVGNMVSALLDEGAGDLDAKTFQQRLEGKAVELSFRSQRDHFYGALRTLREHREEAFDLLRIALSAPRFEQEAIDRIRADVLAGLRRDVTSPNDIASRRWWETAFPDHPYGRLVKGSLETVPLIIQSDLKDYVRSVFTRDRLKVAVVGDIDPAALGAMLDRVFGGLPAKGEPVQVVRMKPSVGSIPVAIEFDVPQTVLIFGKEGISRKDPDFIPAFVVNHILGGGSFSSRLYSEIREKRGMAYSVYSYLASLDSSPLFMGGTATRGDRVSEAMTLIEGEIRRLAEAGPTDEELAKTKSFLKGSYALQFDTSTKIANQLLQIQIEDLGIDYIDRRNSLIEAVAMNDVRRAAKRLLNGKLHWAVVGRSAAGGG